MRRGEFQIDATVDRPLNAAMSKSPFHSAFLFIATVVISANFPSSAHAQQFVSITASGFTPNQLTISIGDSVLWFNYDSNSVHTTTSDKPPGDADYWNRSLNYFEFYTRTFQHAGTFTYHDNVGSFTGTIIVNGPAPLLEAPRLVNGQFVFNATSLTAGKTNALYSSTNLTQWAAIQTNVAISSSMTFTNAAGAGLTFYRLLEIR